MGTFLRQTSYESYTQIKSVALPIAPHRPRVDSKVKFIQVSLLWQLPPHLVPRLPPLPSACATSLLDSFPTSVEVDRSIRGSDRMAGPGHEAHRISRQFFVGSTVPTEKVVEQTCSITRLESLTDALERRPSPMPTRGKSHPTDRTP